MSGSCHERIRRPVPARNPRHAARPRCVRRRRRASTAPARPLAFALGDGTLRLVALADRDDLAHGRGARRRDPRRSRRTPRRPASSPAATTASSAASPRRRGHRHRRLPLEMGGARRQPSAATRARACWPAPSARSIHLFDQTGKKLKELPHPSTVTGLAFDATGKRVGGVALQRRHAVVRRGQDRQPAQAGMEGQPHRASPSIPTATPW